MPKTYLKTATDSDLLRNARQRYEALDALVQETERALDPIRRELVRRGVMKPGECLRDVVMREQE